MTISIFLPIGNKTEEMPLMDVKVHSSQTQPPPPYNAKCLEIRDDGLPNTNNNDCDTGRSVKMIYCMRRSIDYGQLIKKVIKKLEKFMALFLMFLGMLVVLEFCYNSQIEGFKKLDWGQQHDTKNDDLPPNHICLSIMGIMPFPDSYHSQDPTVLNFNSIIDALELINHGKMSLIAVTESAYYLHDYKVNITGIIDSENQSCFVLPLLVSPESQLGKPITTSITFWKTDEILKMYFIMVPTIKNLSDYGSRISKLCANYQTFKMEKHSEFVNSEIVG